MTKRTKDDKSFFSPEYPGRGAYEITFDMMKDFQHLLLDLKESGTVAEINGQIDDLRKVIAIVRNRSLVPALEQEILELEKIRSDMIAAETDLAEMGWKIDPNTGKAVRIAKGHKGSNIIAECVRAIWAARPEGVNNTNGIRLKIAAILRPLFDEKEMRADAQGLIYRAIDKAERRSR